MSKLNPGTTGASTMLNVLMSALPKSMNKHELARLLHVFNDESVVITRKHIQKGFKKGRAQCILFQQCIYFTMVSNG